MQTNLVVRANSFWMNSQKVINGTKRTHFIYASRHLYFHRPRCATGILVDPLWYKDKKKNSCACCLPEDASSERWKIDDLVRLYLAVLIIAASGSSSSLGQEELSAGTDADLVENLSISRNPVLALGQARQAHRLSIQHQLYSRQHGEQGRLKENNKDPAKEQGNITLFQSFYFMHAQ